MNWIVGEPIHITSEDLKPVDAGDVFEAMIAHKLMPLKDVIHALEEMQYKLAGLEIKYPTGYYTQCSHVLLNARAYLCNYNHLMQKEETPSE